MAKIKREASKAYFVATMLFGFGSCFWGTLQLARPDGLKYAGIIVLVGGGMMCGREWMRRRKYLKSVKA